MENIDKIRWILGIVIAVGILTTFWAFSSAVNESLEYARNLDFEKWGKSLVTLFLTGITLAVAGAIGEVITFVINPSRNRGGY